MAYEVVVMSERHGEGERSCSMTTRLEVNGTAASVTTPSDLGIEYHREMVEQAIENLASRR